MESGCAVRRAALCCALVGALACPPLTTAADYSAPDYYVSANVTPYTTSGPITIVFSSANLSDVAAAATTVQFSVAQRAKNGKKIHLGQASVRALGRWETLNQTVSFPLPGGLPVGTVGMKLICNINPARGNGEVKTANNINKSNFNTMGTSVPA